jgi:hypothetical protein
VDVAEIMKMDDEELYCILFLMMEETSAASYQMLSKKLKLPKNLRVNENQLVKYSERNTMSVK